MYTHFPVLAVWFFTLATAELRVLICAMFLSLTNAELLQ